MSLIARMIASGVDADIIEEVALLMAEKKAAERLIEDRKRKATERQQRKRERERERACEGNVAENHEVTADRVDVEDGRNVTQRHATSRNVTQRHVTERDPSLPLPPNEKISNPPTPTHPDINTRASRKTDPEKPESVSQQVWRDFLQLRRQKRAPLTKTALDGIIREAKKANWPLESALVEAITRGWQSFKAEFVEGKKPPLNQCLTENIDAEHERFMRRNPARTYTESEARALMNDREFERWKARQTA